MSKESLFFAGNGVRERVAVTARQLITVRAGLKPYQAGETVQGTFADGPAESLKIISQVPERVNEIHPGLLLLDGFLRPQDLVRMLKSYYEDRLWNLKSTVVRTMFVPTWVESNLRPVEKMRLFYGKEYYDKENFEVDLIKDPLLAKYFFANFCWWLIEFHGMPLENYSDELAARDLVSADRAKGMKEIYNMAMASSKKSSKAADKQTKYLLHHHMLANTPEDLDF